MRKIAVLCFIILFLFTACAPQTDTPQTVTAEISEEPETEAASEPEESMQDEPAIAEILDLPADVQNPSEEQTAVPDATEEESEPVDPAAMMENMRNELLTVSETVMVRKEESGLTIIIQSDVLFDEGAVDVKADAYSEIERVADILAQHPQAFISVEGHTDSKGLELNNLEISKHRANAVMDILLQKGIEASQIAILAFGEKKPVVSNQTMAGRARNRRIEIKVAPSLQKEEVPEIAPKEIPPAE